MEEMVPVCVLIISAKFKLTISTCIVQVEC